MEREGQARTWNGQAKLKQQYSGGRGEGTWTGEYGSSLWEEVPLCPLSPSPNQERGDREEFRLVRAEKDSGEGGPGLGVCVGSRAKGQVEAE